MQDPDLHLANALSALHIDLGANGRPTAADMTPVVTHDPLSRAKLRRERGRIMPGTLFPPRNSHLATESPSQLCSPRAESRNSEEPEEGFQPLTEPTSVEQLSTAPSFRSPIVRSVSMNAREDFLNDLDRVTTHPPVSVYIVSGADLEQLQSSATKVGFRTATAILEKSAQEDEALLIVGMDDAALGDVRGRLVQGDPATSECSKPKGYSLAQVAGGVMVGAAAVFAGLVL